MYNVITKYKYISLNFIKHTRSSACFIIYLTLSLARLNKIVHISSDGHGGKSRLFGNFVACQPLACVCFKMFKNNRKSLFLYSLRMQVFAFFAGGIHNEIYAFLIENVKLVQSLVLCDIFLQCYLKNYDGDIIKARLNEQLKYLAGSERCEFADIAEKKVWNPIATKDTVAFAYSLGLKVQKPIYDLAKILFCFKG